MQILKIIIYFIIQPFIIIFEKYQKILKSCSSKIISFYISWKLIEMLDIQFTENNFKKKYCRLIRENLLIVHAVLAVICLLILTYFCSDIVKNSSFFPFIQYSVFTLIAWVFSCISSYFCKLYDNLLGKIFVAMAFLLMCAVTWMSMADVIYESADIGLLIIASATCLFPVYNFSINLLCVTKNMVIRALISSLSIVVIVGYVSLLFGIYNVNTGFVDKVKQGEPKFVIEYVNYGFERFDYKKLLDSQSKKDAMLATIVQCVIGVMGIFIISHMTKITLEGMDKKM